MNLKKTLTTLALAASLYLPVKADPPQPQRTIQVDSNNPMDNAESNTKVWHSVNQSLGKVGDLLANKTDKHFLGRLAQFCTLGYTNAASRFYSHEFGHARVGRTQKGYKFKLDLRDWSKGYPNFDATYTQPITKKADNAGTVSGMNQEQLNSQFLHSKTIDTQTFDEGLGYILTNSENLLYGIWAFSKPLDKFWDPVSYIQELNEDGIAIQRKDFLIQSGLALGISTKFWDSILANTNYLFKGERTRKTTKLKIKDTEITPPLVNLYLTPKGSFFNTTTYIENENLWEISLGIDDTYIGESKLDRVRAGIKLVNKPILGVQASPFAYTNLSRSKLQPKGYSAGLELFKPLTKRLGISAKYEYNKNDVLENTVKGESNSHNFTIGLEMKL